MLIKLLLALLLMASCVVIHAAGVTWALHRVAHAPHPAAGFWPSTLMCVRLAGWMIGCHLVEICLWGLLYLGAGAIPGLQSAFYFSAVTYTTTGYGDLVLPPDWRLVGGIEALTGILMSGWSTAFFFAVLSGLYAADART
jgi:hypothetical protein